MKLILDYFYSICGYQEGWCSKKDNCKFRINLWQISDGVRYCEYFIERHPITNERYKEFILRRQNG